MEPFGRDPAKEAANVRSHGITFEEAWTVVQNPLSTEQLDIDHSHGDERLKVIGWSPLGRVIVVIVSASGPVPRIISARRATKRERDAYTG